MGRISRRFGRWRMILTAFVFLFLLLFRNVIIFAEEELGEKNSSETGETPDPEETDKPGGKEEESRWSEPEIICSHPDGQNGWYLTPPEIKIVHTELCAETVYKVTAPSGRVLEGSLRTKDPEEAGGSEETEEKEEADGTEETEEKEEAGEMEEDGKKTDQEALCGIAAIPPAAFEEGENLIEVWMVSLADGEELFRTEQEILFDLNPPDGLEINIPAYRDGNRTFFHSPPEIDIKCTDTGSGAEYIQVTLDGGGEQRQEKIEGNSGTIHIPLGFKGRISVCAADRAGRRSDILVSAPVLCEDEAPEITMEIVGGAEGWRQSAAGIKVHVKEPGDKYAFSSGIRSITCYVGEKIAVKKNWGYKEETVLSDTVSFEADQASESGKGLPVTVHVSDRAGNTSVLTKEIFIDVRPPEIEVSGVRDGMITAQKQKAVFMAGDENVLKDCRLTVTRMRPDGQSEMFLDAGTEEWVGSPQEKRFEAEFTEDGKYVCSVCAEDASGRRTEKTLSFVIDQTNPVIRYVDQLDGASIPYFEWNYGKEMIVDLTENSYIIYLNGRQYFPGTKVTKEGKKLLEVRARDQAGNESAAAAVFTVDHTPPKIFWGEIKNGDTCKGGAVLSLWVTGEDERLRTVIINGERQKLDYESRVFEYAITQNGDYTVSAEAEDLAGNLSEEKISFAVREKGGMPVIPGVFFRSGDHNSAGHSGEAGAFHLSVVFMAAGTVSLCIWIIRRKIRKDVHEKRNL